MNFLQRIKQSRLAAAFIVLSLVINPIFTYQSAQAADIASPSFHIDNSISFMGIKANPQNPLDFELMLDTAGYKFQESVLQEKSNDFIQYFLTSLTLDDANIWVNLSPDEPERMLHEDFAKTLMGTQMLAADEQLKRSAAALTDPATESGRAYWNLLNAHGVEASADVLSRIWIVPGQLELAKNENAILIEDAKLELKNENYNSNISPIAVKAVTDHIIPALKEEINKSDDFAQLRQMFRAYVAAVWYKTSLRNSIINKVYSGKGKVSGLDSSDKAKCEEIYQSYLNSFKEGVVNKYVKERDINSGRLVKRHYFSGGVTVDKGLVSSSIKKAKKLVGTMISDAVMVEFDLDVMKDKDAKNYLRPYFLSKQPPISIIRDDLYKRIVPFVKQYERLVLRGKEDFELYANRRKYMKFLSDFADSFESLNESEQNEFLYSKDPSIRSFNRTLILLNSYIYSESINYNEGAGDSEINDPFIETVDRIFGDIRDRMSDLNYEEHLKGGYKHLYGAIEKMDAGEDITLTIHLGHEGMDDDSEGAPTQGSQVFAAYDGDNGNVHVPVLTSDDLLSTSTLFFDKDVANSTPRLAPALEILHSKGLLDKVKWVLYDHNKVEQFEQHFDSLNLSDDMIQKLKDNIVEIFDHHDVNGLVSGQPVTANIEKSNGSTVGFIAQMYLGLGIIPPHNIVRSLSAVTLIDSENLDPMVAGYKATIIHEAMTRKRSIFGGDIFKDKILPVVHARPNKVVVKDETKVYGTDHKMIFSVDESSDGLFHADGNVRDESKFNEFISEEKARLYKHEKDPVFSIFKLYDREIGGVVVNAERIYVAYNTEKYDFQSGLASQVLEKVREIYSSMLGLSYNDLVIVETDDGAYLQITNAHAHLQRKNLDGPVLKVLEEKSELFTKKSSSAVKKVGGVRFGDGSVAAQVDDMALDIDFAGIDVENFNGFTYQIQGIVLPKAYDSYTVAPVAI